MLAIDRFTFAALFGDLLLGFVVFATNTRRPTSRSYLLLTFTAAAWLIGIHYAVLARTAADAIFWIRFCSVFGALVMPSLGMIRISIIYYQETWWQHFKRVRWWFGIALVISGLDLSSYFLLGVRLNVPPDGGLVTPEPTFGWAVHAEHLYIYGSLLFTAYSLMRDQFSRHIQGVQRVELQFVMLACLTVLASILIKPLLQRFGGSVPALQLAPLKALLFHLIIAYGITSRGILHVKAIFRLMLSYLLLGIYAAFIFTAAWFFFIAAFRYFGNDSVFAPAICVAIVTALLFNATGTPVRRLTKRILPPEIDFEKIVTDLNNAMQSVTTLEALFERFSLMLGKSIGSPAVRVLLRESGMWRMPLDHPGKPAEAENLCLPPSDPLVLALCAGTPDVAIEELQRRAPSPERDGLLARMAAIDADLFVPILYHGELSGALAIAPRSSGHLYGSTGRATLRLIARQLGVAIANAHLYTEARRSQAYNQFLVEHLPCGIIATDAAGALTVLNPEARRLLTLDELAPPGEQDLPMEIAGLIPPTLEGDFIGRDEEIILSPGARDEVNLRVSCLPFASERDELLGAILMLNNHTQVERLQRQVRQADRLASIGTLASGMAHEIKNPLTALKTFTQLLPKRYQDAEFRSDFTGVVGGEILRIERIVNQLLAFARPAPLMIEQVNLHDLVNSAVRLVSPQAARQSIQVRTSLQARHDFVAADKDRLQQVLLNLMLNAIQASGDGSWIELATETEEARAEPDGLVRLDVRDAGHGISKELLPHIFDPFFTTKSEGTGLGLSVSYNIIAEHKGRMEVQSEPGRGTCFSIYLPTC